MAVCGTPKAKSPTRNQNLRLASVIFRPFCVAKDKLDFANA
jgi:hypothetical protein